MRAAALRANGGGEHGGDFTQLGAGVAYGCGYRIAPRTRLFTGKRQTGLRYILRGELCGVSTAAHLIERLTGAGERVSLAMHQAIDLKNNSTSRRRYRRWPVPLLLGFSCGNCVSQKRRT